MKPRDSLQRSLDRLERALAEGTAGREREWSEQVDDTLTEVERALRQHAEAAQDSGGMFAEVDVTRLSRRIGELDQEHEGFLKQVHALQEEVQTAARAFRTHTDPGQATPMPAKAVAIPDFGTIRMHVEALLAALRQHHHAETGLLLEGVTTDIGAGD